MKKELIVAREDSKISYTKKVNVSQHSGAGGLWFIGFIGALTYYLHFHSGTFRLVVLAFFKAIFWVAFLVYYLLHFMKV
jgi:hypothetical protein